MYKAISFLSLLLLFSLSSCVFEEAKEEIIKPIIFTDALLGKWRAKQIITSKTNLNENRVIESETENLPTNYAYFLQFDGRNQVILEDTNNNGVLERRDTVIYKVEESRIIYTQLNDTANGSIIDNQLILSNYFDYTIDSINYRDTKTTYLDRLP